MFDIDNSKTFKDNNSNVAGDKVLHRLGELMKEISRDEDIPCRFFWEEFLVILPDCDSCFSARRAGDIRKAIERLPVFHRGQMLKVTVSLGVASFPKNGCNQNEVVSMADSALYQAKEAGRNCVVLADSSLLE